MLNTNSRDSYGRVVTGTYTYAYNKLSFYQTTLLVSLFFCDVLEAEYQRTVAALDEAGLQSLLPFVKEQGLRVSSLLL